MSFILDALRKVEEERKGEPDPESVIAIEGGREWGEPRSFLRVSVAAASVLALVAVGLAGYNLVRSRDRAPATPLSSNSVAPNAAPPSLPSPAPTFRSAAPSVKTGEFPPASKGAAAEPKPEPVSMDIEAEPEPTPPVRLVGRGGHEIEVASAEPPPSEPAPSEPAPTEPTPELKADPVLPVADLNDGLPQLVLQGTATVEDRPVAIVNYQRVFEGDIIEGARVVKIHDRSIELEYLGRRYTIRF